MADHEGDTNINKLLNELTSETGEEEFALGDYDWKGVLVLVLKKVMDIESRLGEDSLSYGGTRPKATGRNLEHEIDELVKSNDKLRESTNREIEELKKENEKLRKLLESTNQVQREVRVIKENQNVWEKDKVETQETLKQIMEEQKKEQEISSKDFNTQFVKAIKEKDYMIRETVDKARCVMIFGDTEEDNKMIQQRQEADIKKAKKILTKIDTDEREWAREVEEVRRLGKYKKGESRPAKIYFRTRRTAEEVLSYSWRLSKDEEFKHITIRKDLTMEERKQAKERFDDVKRKNEVRTEEERSLFFWKVCGITVRKWYIKRGDREGAGEELIGTLEGAVAGGENGTSGMTLRVRK